MRLSKETTEGRMRKILLLGLLPGLLPAEQGGSRGNALQPFPVNLTP
jgi:hypothetical protein